MFRKKIKITVAVILPLSALAYVAIFTGIFEKRSFNILITPKTWNLLELDEEFRKAGLKVGMLREIGMLREKRLIIPSELRFKKIKVETLLIETAKFNGDLKLWHSEDKTRILFYRKVDPEKLSQVKKNLLSKDKSIRLEAIWKAGWLAHPELILPLAKIAESNDRTFNREAMRALLRIGISACSICIGEKAIPFLRKDMEDKLGIWKITEDVHNDMLQSPLEALEIIGGGKSSCSC